MNEYVTFDRDTEDYLNDLCRREALCCSYHELTNC